jgi:hypothetical protein
LLTCPYKISISSIAAFPEKGAGNALGRFFAGCDPNSRNA